MQVFQNLDHLPEFHKTVFTQGIFDGVHLGHQKLLEKVVDYTKSIGGNSILLTFWPHPRLLLYPEDNDLKLIQTLDEKLKVIESLGIDTVIVLPFTKLLSETLPSDYINNFLVNTLNVHTVMVGYDHRFGKNRAGDIHVLRQYSSVYNYVVNEIAAKDIDDITISSTKIRNAILEGDMEKANQYLGRQFSFSGIVVKGLQLGTKLGYPTANVQINDKNKIIPANGVYAVRALVHDKLLNGMMSIGENPTVENKSFSIEVNLFNFNSNIYGKEITVFPIKKIREEKKFENLDELVQNLQIDKTYADKILMDN
jgi:riboflavin kinase/FMN adenylyltransferase